MALRLPDRNAAPARRPARTGMTLINMVLMPSIRAVVAASRATDRGRLYFTAAGKASRQTSAPANRAAEVFTSLRKTQRSSQPAP